MGPSSHSHMWWVHVSDGMRREGRLAEVELRSEGLPESGTVEYELSHGRHPR